MFSKTGRTFSCRALAALMAVVLMGLLSQPAEAFWKKKKNDETEPSRAANMNLYPEMTFFRGTVHRGSWGAWELDNRPLSFLPEARVTTGEFSGGTSLLRDGGQGLVQGFLSEGTLVVYQVTLFDLDQTLQGNRYIRQRVLDLPVKMPQGAPR